MVDVRSLRDTGALHIGSLRSDILDAVLSFLSLVGLATSTVLSKSLHAVACDHGHWRLFVLQSFGAYYDDYVTKVDRHEWRRLLIYIRRVHASVDRSEHAVRVFSRTLRPPERYASNCRNGRRYRGSIELVDNCSSVIWENGRYVQVMRVCDGKILHDLDTGSTCRRYFHRIANWQNRLFVAVHDSIKMWDLSDPNPSPTTLAPPFIGGEPSTWAEVSKRRARPLELLVHKKRLVLFETNALYFWHTETLQPLSCVEHCDPDMTPGAHHLEVQWMGERCATWQRGLSARLNVWTLDGQLETVLANEHVVVQLDVVRVTWQDVRELGHFLLAALDEASQIKIWDTNGFTFLCSFNAGCAKPFDLVITQDFLATVNDNVQANKLEIEFWKLWMSTGENSTAMRSAKMTGHCWNDLSDGNARARTRPCFEMMRRLSLDDVDSYFASYRNYFNVCSYHKNGCESVKVFRSKTLQKKIHFRPAKHTKFEEWLAIQVDDAGTVTIYDFRPDGTGFEELPVHALSAPRAPRPLIPAVPHGLGSLQWQRPETDECSTPHHIPASTSEFPRNWAGMTPMH